MLLFSLVLMLLISSPMPHLLALRCFCSPKLANFASAETVSTLNPRSVQLNSCSELSLIICSVHFRCLIGCFENQQKVVAFSSFSLRCFHFTAQGKPIRFCNTQSTHIQLCSVIKRVISDASCSDLLKRVRLLLFSLFCFQMSAYRMHIIFYLFSLSRLAKYCE